MAEILVVDDDTDIAAALVDLLELDGHRVRSASSGVEGLARLREQLVDLVLVDVEMPQLDGPGMADAMLRDDRGLEHIPLILVSGVDDLAAVARRVGTPYHLAKPFAFDTLARMVERALREKVPPLRARPSPDAMR